jgi:acetyl esterase/lipase
VARRDAWSRKPLAGALLVLAAIHLAAAFPDASAQSAAPPDTVLLWPEGAPGAVGDAPEDRPTLTVFLPSNEKATGTGLVICPGGSYTALAMEKEGFKVARWLNGLGVAAFVLKYRLGPRYHHPAPLQDAQRALRHVRAHAEDLGVQPDRLGIVGFSAGGHLAATTATVGDRVPAPASEAGASDAVNDLRAQPDLLILAYPVISLAEAYTHEHSRTMLLGDDPDPALVQMLSAERQVSARTPPTFIFSTNEDEGVPVENSLAFFQALRAAGVPAELHVYERGPHGVGMAAEDPVLGSWMDRLKDWLMVQGWLARE